MRINNNNIKTKVCFFKFINIAHQIYFEFILLNDVNNVVFIDNSKSAGKTNGLNPEKS